MLISISIILDGIANYINTVENSAAPQLAPEQPAGNPYAGHMPGVARPAAGLTKQPVATSISCAKCKIEKPKGKISKQIFFLFINPNFKELENVIIEVIKKQELNLSVIGRLSLLFSFIKLTKENDTLARRNTTF